MVSNPREDCLSPTSASAYMLRGGALTLVEVEEEGGAIVVVVEVEEMYFVVMCMVNSCT